MKERIITQNLDANETAFFERELEHIKARSYDVIYPEFMAYELIPIETDAGPGAETITYRQYDHVGMAKIIASYADDLPRSDIKGLEFTARVKGIGGAYGYSIQEIRRANMTGLPLEQRKANASRHSNDQLTNQIAWFGNSAHGIEGLLYNTNVTKTAAVNGAWLTATPDDIIEDVNTAIGAMLSTTKGVERPDTVAIATKQHAHIASTPRSATSDTTILEFLRRVWPGITFYSVPEFEALAIIPSTGGAGPTDIMLIFRRSADKLGLQIPQTYEQFPAQERNLEFVVPTHSRTAGVIVYYPLSVTVVDGLEV
jgi:hypothetical protein